MYCARVLLENLEQKSCGYNVQQKSHEYTKTKYTSKFLILETPSPYDVGHNIFGTCSHHLWLTGVFSGHVADIESRVLFLREL